MSDKLFRVSNTIWEVHVPSDKYDAASITIVQPCVPGYNSDGYSQVFFPAQSIQTALNEIEEIDNLLIALYEVRSAIVERKSEL